MIYRNDIANLREDLEERVGQKIIVKGSLGRSKFFEKQATLQRTYPNFIVVKYDEEEGNATYSYTDVLTRTIDLQLYDGESYSSILPPRVEEPKRMRKLANQVVQAV